MREWAVARVNHCELVRAYYGGAFSVRRASLQMPAGAFFAVRGASDGGSQRTHKKKKKKRKRADDALTQLIARGKFVPLDERVRRMLQAAHDEIVRDFAASDFLPTWSSSESPDTLSVLPDAALVLSRSDSPSLFSNESDRVQLAVVDASGGDNPTPSLGPVASDASRGDRVPNLFLLPPRASFAAADVRHLDALGLPSDFKWIVMDPPWENKSVSRAHRYVTFRHEELLNVDVPGLADPEACVLAVWVTNKPSYTSFLMEKALPRWGFTLHDTWFWLKICADGELVTPLESTHRLPFEKLIVAYRGATEASRSRLRQLLGDKTRVVASVPLRHSWKPPPESFFPAGAIGASDRKAELFARELRPRWTSVGLEVSARA